MGQVEKTDEEQGIPRQEQKIVAKVFARSPYQQENTPGDSDAEQLDQHVEQKVIRLVDKTEHCQGHQREKKRKRVLTQHVCNSIWYYSTLFPPVDLDQDSVAN